MKPAVRGLYAVTPELALEALLEAVSAAIAGGARLVQYRDKCSSSRQRLRQAKALQALCRRHGVPLIINDDPALASTVGAAGVHLGAADVSPGAARRRLGPRALIGVSCYASLSRAEAAQAAGADYVAFGSFYPSPTKPGACRAPLELLQQAKRALKIPVVAIGGITPANGAGLVARGADAVAVIHGLFGSEDIEAAARCYARLFPDHSESGNPSRTTTAGKAP
ncbi:MAG TPA: thiamine phosphate synthase [Gammaproteobacteria bacterium]|nr:thiamine phosphate synthase [Gammaproteobacteria bacterium]